MKPIFTMVVWSAALLVGCASAGSPQQDSSTISSTPKAIMPVESQATSTTEISQPTPEAGEPNKADADVLKVRAVLEEAGTWTFHVTVSHPDTGWDDYADGWDVVTEGGEVLKQSGDDLFTRLLLHPHETEQPFTRSQGGISIPETDSTVIVRAHDIVDGFGGQEVIVDLTASSGPSYVVERN